MIRMLKKTILVILILSPFPAAGELQVLTAGADIDYAPFSYSRENGPEGFDIHFFRLLADRLEREPVVKLDTWHKVLENAAKGGYDAVLGAVYKQERDEYLAFSVPYNSIRLTLVVHKESELSGTEDLWNREMAGLREDAVSALYLARNNIPVRTVEYDTLNEALRHLNNGKHDFCIIPEPYIEEYLNSSNFDNIRVANDNLATLTYRIGLSGESEHLLPEIDRHIKNILESEEYSRLRKTWLFSEEDGETGLNKKSSRVWIFAVFGSFLLGGLLLFHLLMKKIIQPAYSRGPSWSGRSAAVSDFLR